MLRSISARDVIAVVRTLRWREKIAFVALAVVAAVGAVGLLSNISAAYMTRVPLEGGTFREGIVGTPRFINPVLALSDADRDMTALVYSGLLRSDTSGKLVPDLAESYDISTDARVYTFTLKPDLVWHDGEPITADDVVFTIEAAQDANVKSPRRASWEGVRVEKTSDRTVAFTLDRPYAPFLESTVIGILPKHIWERAAGEQMIFSDFNVRPVGSGPYRVEKTERDSSGIITSYTLTRNDDFALGTPLLDTIIARFYASEEKVIEAYRRGIVDAVAALTPTRVADILRSDSAVRALHLPRVFAAFFNQNQAAIFAAAEVREALNRATDKDRIVQEVLDGFGTVLEYPIPPGTFGAIEEVIEEPYDPPRAQNEARDLLLRSGWKPHAKDGIMEKKTRSGTLRLQFTIATGNVPALTETAALLEEMWEDIGADVTVSIFESGDLNQNVIRPRRYDVLLFGIIAGRDPDPFAFWHSSQRNDPGLNIALYANITADKLLEEARVAADETERVKRYRAFQREVVDDTPAVFLFSPRFIYIVPDDLKGAGDQNTVVVPSERFAGVHRWYTNTQNVWNIFVR